MRSSYITPAQMEHILAAMMPENRLVMRVALATGLRVSDVLSIKTCRLKSRMTVRELKTGKSRRVRIPAELLDEMRCIAGRYYVFEGRCSQRKHRSRQAVYKDVKRAAAVFKRSGSVPKNAQVSPHSARKIAAVRVCHERGFEAAQRMLNHDDPAVTMLYALSDEIEGKNGCQTQRKRR